MFKVLDNKAVTSTELADAYKQAVEAEQGLKTEQNKAYEALLDIQKDCLTSTKESKPLEKAKVVYETAKIRLEACQHGAKQLRERMFERLPIVATAIKKAIEAEQNELISQKRDINEKYLSKIAEALAIQEQAKGRPMSDAGRGNWVERGVRNINLSLLIDEDRNYLHEQVKTFRESLPIQGGVCLDIKLSCLGDEMDKLSKILSEPNPADDMPGQVQLSIAEKIENEVGKLIGLSA